MRKAQKVERLRPPHPGQLALPGDTPPERDQSGLALMDGQAELA